MLILHECLVDTDDHAYLKQGKLVYIKEERKVDVVLGSYEYIISQCRIYDLKTKEVSYINYDSTKLRRLIDVLIIHRDNEIEINWDQWKPGYILFKNIPDDYILYVLKYSWASLYELISKYLDHDIDISCVKDHGGWYHSEDEWEPASDQDTSDDECDC